MIRIDPDLAIPLAELGFATARSSGPGGQNVNKTSTRVTLLFDVAGSPSLSPRQRELLKSRLATRMSKGGVLRVTSQRHRTQAQNRSAAVERFVELLREALAEEAPRVATKIPPPARYRRLEEKRRRSRLKELRRPEGEWEQE
jgi:ribosome-associated protein